MGESWFLMLMLECSSPRAVILPLIPFIWTSEWVTCFLASFGRREIGTMQVEHTESNIATPEKVILLTVKAALMSGDWCKGSFWRLNMWWLEWNMGRPITSRLVRTENPVPRCLWIVYPLRCYDMGLSLSRRWVTIWAATSVKASDALCIVLAYGGFSVAVVHSVRLIIIIAVFAEAGLLRVRWSIIWSWWLFWFRSSIYLTRSLWSMCIICHVRLCCPFLHLDQRIVGLRRLCQSLYSGCLLFGFQSLTFSLISTVPMIKKTISTVKSTLLSFYLFFMWTAASLMVFSSRPAKSVNFSPSRRCKSQARLRCWKFVIWLPWVPIR